MPAWNQCLQVIDTELLQEMPSCIAGRLLIYNAGGLKCRNSFYCDPKSTCRNDRRDGKKWKTIRLLLGDTEETKGYVNRKGNN
jgi:hypothetical protein